MFHCGMYPVAVFYHFQYPAGASFSATTASGTIIFIYQDNSLPVFPLAVQFNENQQQDCD
jgi:hypothetical protein